MLDKLAIEDLRNRVGETFGATAGDGRQLALTLTSVEELSGSRSGGRTPFSLEFRDEAQNHVPQQTVRMEHPELGAFDVFIVPLGPAPEGMRYEAIFT